MPGVGVLTAGTASMQLPFDVVSDDAWEYSLSPLPDNGNGGWYEVRAKFADGTTAPWVKTARSIRFCPMEAMDCTP